MDQSLQQDQPGKPSKTFCKVVVSDSKIPGSAEVYGFGDGTSESGPTDVSFFTSTQGA